MKRLVTVIMVLVMMLGTFAAAEHLVETVPAPQVGSIGGEWAIIALARSGADVPNGYYEDYLNRVEQKLIECGGVLHNIKRTEYARVSLALAALGENPAAFRGYDLLSPLTETDMVKIQGNNGPIWALIALDSGDFAAVDEAREALISYILSVQNEDGSWGLVAGDTPNIDLTAMALTALAKYSQREDVAESVALAVTWLRTMQTNTGYDTSESVAQALVAYSALHMQEDAAHMRQCIENFAVDGGYCHELSDATVNGMATEQASYAIAAYDRMCSGQNALFDMRDSK